MKVALLSHVNLKRCVASGLFAFIVGGMVLVAPHVRSATGLARESWSSDGCLNAQIDELSYKNGKLVINYTLYFTCYFEDGLSQFVFTKNPDVALIHVLDESGTKIWRTFEGISTCNFTAPLFLPDRFFPPSTDPPKSVSRPSKRRHYNGSEAYA